MSGARLVLNSRYFHIARAGEKADGKYAMTKEAAMGLVNYVGTRESVVLNVPDQISLQGTDPPPLNLDPLKLKPEVARRPATKKQMDTITDLLREIPEAKNSLEYQDYMRDKTIGNATELISRAAEIGLGYAVGIGEATNLVDYVANRPGVDRVGGHGLFSSSSTVDIRKAQEEIADCKGNIWTHVISLRREDADRLGYDQQKPWRDLILTKVDMIAKASNIPVADLHWYAGMHNTTHHPHIHLFVFSDNPKAGRLTVQGINRMKAEFSKVIFADERRQIYVHKTELRDEIKHKVDEILSNLGANTTDQFSPKDLEKLCGSMSKLAAELKDRPGKIQYGWIKDLNIREQVNGIMADLARTPDIQKLYELYCEDHKELQRMYRNDPKDTQPIVKNKEFANIKNKILREAAKLGQAVSAAELDAHRSGVTDGVMDHEPDSLPEEDSPPSSLFSEDDRSLFEAVPEERPGREPPEDYEPADSAEHHSEHGAPIRNIRAYKGTSSPDSFEKCMVKAMNGSTEAKYQLAKMYFYGTGTERDPTQAQMWFGLAAADGHTLAKYELGKMYLYGIGIEKDPELAREYLHDAYWSLRADVSEAYGYDVGEYVGHGLADELDLPKSKASYLMYCLGRMEYAGEGIDRDFVRALQWYRLAAGSGHVHSNYCAGKMHAAGEGVEQDYRKAKERYGSAAEGKDKYAYYALGRMYETGSGVEQDDKKAVEWYARASQENVPYADYRLAQLVAIGKGTDPDKELAGILYRKALDGFTKQEEQQPDASVEFRIAQMYLYGTGVEKDPEKAAEWLKKSCGQQDPRVQYELAQLYREGTLSDPSMAQAQDLYRQALQGFLKREQETPSAAAEYKIAGMYAHGYGTDPDETAAFTWHVKAAERGHIHAAYRAAKACLFGTGTRPDPEQAVKWFRLAAQGGDPYAMYSLGRLYLSGSILEKDPVKAYGFFLAAAKLGHEQAQYAAAKALLSGTGTQRDPITAVRWLEKCVEKGHHAAEYQLAELLSAGTDVPGNESRAQQLYASALAGFLSQEQEKPDAQLEYRIGDMYLHGKGVPADPAAAFHWFSVSAQNGNAYAAYRAAGLLAGGNGIPRDEARAQEFYTQALRGFLHSVREKPDASLRYRIGTMYEFGMGTERDTETAKQWYSAAAAEGNEAAAARLEEIRTYEAKMTADSVMGLLRAFAGNLRERIDDSTTHKYRQDHRLRQKQRQMGLRPEEEPVL